MGSVKDLTIIRPAIENAFGEGHFTFSDRYSVFDWGEMPDQIDHKGAAIALMGAYFFEKLADRGVPTHYRGLVEDGRVKSLAELEAPSNVMAVTLVRVLTPRLQDGTYDYAVYRVERGNFLIPLEVIYRNRLPAGSSVFKRLAQGDITPRDMGLDAMPTADQRLDPPILDVSTKLEITDRYLSWAEAQELAGLDYDELQALKTLTTGINTLISKEFERIGMVNEDGKIEVGFTPERKLMLVDVLGTLDECRFTLDGLPVSKEYARIYYRDTPWSRDVEAAKQTDRQNWKTICASSPPSLPEDLKTVISQLYCACTNDLTGRQWFPDVPPTRDLVSRARHLLAL